MGIRKTVHCNHVAAAAPTRPAEPLLHSSPSP